MEINVEIQRAEHAQANSDVKTAKPFFRAIKPILFDCNHYLLYPHAKPFVRKSVDFPRLFVRKSVISSETMLVSNRVFTEYKGAFTELYVLTQLRTLNLPIYLL